VAQPGPADPLTCPACCPPHPVAPPGTRASTRLESASLGVVKPGGPGASPVANRTGSDPSKPTNAGGAVVRGYADAADDPGFLSTRDAGAASVAKNTQARLGQGRAPRSTTLCPLHCQLPPAASPRPANQGAPARAARRWPPPAPQVELDTRGTASRYDVTRGLGQGVAEVRRCHPSATAAAAAPRPPPSSRAAPSAPQPLCPVDLAPLPALQAYGTDAARARIAGGGFGTGFSSMSGAARAVTFLPSELEPALAGELGGPLALSAGNRDANRPQPAAAGAGARPAAGAGARPLSATAAAHAGARPAAPAPAGASGGAGGGGANGGGGTGGAG
jgi:hypothetical protein